MRGEYEEPAELIPEEDPAEKIRQLTEENDRLKMQVKALKETASGKKKIEFSKLIYVGGSILSLAVIIFICYMIWITGDTSALAYLIPAIFAERAASKGFYSNKAKTENKIKLMALYGVKPEASDFNIES